jgi:hypothetical protein
MKHTMIDKSSKTRVYKIGNPTLKIEIMVVRHMAGEKQYNEKF